MTLRTFITYRSFPLWLRTVRIQSMTEMTSDTQFMQHHWPVPILNPQASQPDWIEKSKQRHKYLLIKVRADLKQHYQSPNSRHQDSITGTQKCTKNEYISSKIYLLNVMLSEKNHLVIDNYFKITIINNAQRL